jgi:MFS family permease
MIKYIITYSITYSIIKYVIDNIGDGISLVEGYFYSLFKGNNKLLWIYTLSASVYFTQGVEGMPGMALFFYLKEKLHLDPSTIMYIGSVTGIAWLIKPIWGYLCDNYLSKKLWIILSLIGSLGICFYLGLSPFISIPILIALLTIANLTTAFRDVATDGIMCVEGKEANECGRIQAIQWTSITVAGIIVGLIGGYIADHYNYQLAYLTLIPIYLLIIGIVLKYKTTQPLNQQLEKICVEQIKVPVWQTILSYKELFTNKRFLVGCLFVFLYNFNPSFGTPLSFIERDVFKWSGTFMSLLGALGSAIGIIGSILYFKFGKRINITKVLYWSVFLGALTTLSYLYFTPVSAIIYTVVYSVLGMFIFLNVMAWMAEATIKGKEATSFALLCSVNNLAGTVSGLSGAYLFSRIGLTPLIIVSALTSFLCLPLIKHLQENKNGQTL